MGEWPKEVGFTNISYKIHKVPLNPWPKDKGLKEQGMYCGLYMDLRLDGFVNFPIEQILGWTQEEVQILVAKFRSAIRNPKNLPVAYMYVPDTTHQNRLIRCSRHCVYGQKPKNPAA